MKEKTRVLMTITAIFALAVVVVAFGSFIEDQKELNAISSVLPKEIQVNDNTKGKLELENEINKIKKYEISKETIKEQARCQAIKLSE